MEIDVEEETDLADARELFGLADIAGAGDLPATIFTRLRLSRPDDAAIQVEPPLTAG